ncbi:hypothetical protein HFN89_01360 [Rhizobium laguerreae]|nr:hypothetical protein [Rhizobium laguerreae]
MAKQTRAERIVHANELIRHIAAHGRRFFHYGSVDRTAAFELTDSSRVRFRDECTGLLVDTGREGRWNPQKFSGGGTMQRLVAALGRYVSKGEKIDKRHFGPWAEWMADGDLWGYGFEEMQKVREGIAGSDCVDWTPVKS